MDVNVLLIALDQMNKVQLVTAAGFTFVLAVAFMGLACLSTKVGHGVAAAICGVISVASVIIGFSYLYRYFG